MRSHETVFTQPSTVGYNELVRGVLAEACAQTPGKKVTGNFCAKRPKGRWRQMVPVTFCLSALSESGEVPWEVPLSASRSHY